MGDVIVTSGASIIVALIVLWGTRMQQRTAATATKTSSETSALQSQLDSWDKLADQRLRDVERLTKERDEALDDLAEERAIGRGLARRNETLEARVTALESENNELRADREGGR